MFITAITHAAARDKAYSFRGLTAAGQEQAQAAAARYTTLIAGSDLPAIDTVVSSPKPRCLETVILFAKALGDQVAAGAVSLAPSLTAGSVTGPELGELVATCGGQHLLVCAHADLVKALPDRDALVADAATDGWFTIRPVLLQLEHESGEHWQAAYLRFCDGLRDGSWEMLLAP
jgi:broad specificity phosphatase PhoE